MATDVLKLIAVIGPTASGKTRLGIELANRLDGEIISADSMQIYRYMDIGTAKPTVAERAAAVHHLIDIINPDQNFNAGNFVELADQQIRQLADQQKATILLGGTSLYVRALLNGIIQVPDTPAEIKERIQNLLKTQGLPALYQLLQKHDPESAKDLHPNDISRVSRALEVYWTTGKSIREFQRQHQFQQNRYQVMKIGCEWDRQTLYQRINRRVERMVQNGLLEEVQDLLNRGYSPNLPALQSIGYKQVVDYLQGKISEAEMINDIQQKTRRYAKKQLTWYRRDETVNWLQQGILTEDTLERARLFLNQDAPCK